MNAQPMRIVLTMMAVVLLMVTCSVSAQTVGSASPSPVLSPVPGGQTPLLWVSPVNNFPWVVWPASTTGMTLAFDNQLLLGWFPWAWTAPYTPPTRPFMPVGVPKDCDLSVGTAGRY